MAQAVAESEPEALRATLRKLRRRQGRNERAAWARGYLLGICSLLRPGDLAIDCGANVGDVSAQLLQTGAEVIGFEPDPWAVARLAERFAGEPRFRLINAAVGATGGVTRLMRAGGFAGNEKNASVKSTIVAGGRQIDADPAHTITVEKIDLAAFLRDLVAERGEIAFLKMDVEGAELEILPALDNAGLFAKVRATVVETHERKFAELRPAFARLRADITARYPASRVNLDWI